MTEHTDDPEVPEWVRRMRADGYTVRIGAGTGGIPFEPEVAFTPPGESRDEFREADGDCVEALEGRAIADLDPPLRSDASTMTQTHEEADRREEPYWVAGLRAKGYTVRVGTGKGGIPFEPEVAFTPPHQTPHGLRARLIGIVRKLWKGGAFFKRHTTTLPDRHAPLP